MSAGSRRTWDGKPVSPEPPFGASVLVYRRVHGELEWLVLHRRRAATGGDWAWTPPSGARLPDRPVDECAKRELWEETGLRVPIERTRAGTEEWVTYVAVETDHHEITLDEVHDHFEWVTGEEAGARCQPAVVADTIRRGVALVKRPQ